ncbi:MAG: GNAT family N-acetyltransferase [Bacteroidales bacterium]|nr:GNAT family N-acetyltransferase [Bacteroidales bacterium]MCF8390852.1 GNAT family N-acetyltransferase [Bacteroidales bacterium]
MIKSEIITENLFAFYKQIVEKTNSDSLNFRGLENVCPADNSWPAYVLSNKFVERDELKAVGEKMKSGAFSPFWIRETMENDPFDGAADEFGIRKINNWKGMYLEREEVFNLPAPMENLKFERVNTEDEIGKWLTLVNSENLKGRKISQQVFKNLLSNDAFNFFQLSYEENVISTALMFNFRASVGLYLISTQEKHRGKGLGKYITSKAIDYFIQNAYTKFVLHSTKSGYPLYKKLGFETVCDYGIYWLVGKI